MVRGYSSLLALAVLALTVLPLNAAELKDGDCLACHSQPSFAATNTAGKVVSLFVDTARLAASVHRTNACVSCHADATAAHPEDGVRLRAVTCARCHERQTESYNASVHGLALKAGHADAATCQDCHGSHDIVAGESPASPLYFARQAGTCGGCHDKEAQDWAAGVHGRAVLAGKRDAPTCTDCHSEHKIVALEGSRPLKISDVCSRCHASVRLDAKYNLPADRVKTYVQSYHGLAAQYGSTVVANCASCHGFHKVLPSSDPDSTINTNHLVATCGQCHPGANKMFVSGKIHVDLAATPQERDLGGRINRWVRRIYLVLIFGVIGAMFVHNLLLFLKKTSARLRASIRPILRLSTAQRWQHCVLAGSFFILAITGFALKFPDSWLAKLLGSNEPFRRWTHRIAGIVLLSVGLWHLIYLFTTRDGRQLLRDLLPIRKDWADVVVAVKYLCGLSRQRPQMGRFGYAEKIEYWAVVWGTVIMGITGLMMWFKIDVTHWAPRWIVDVAMTIHYYEAVLACLAILVWHFYHVIFDPDVYPLNPACLDGRVSEEWQAHEHPLEPVKPDYSRGEKNAENAP
jgi:formate dehydrogenase gamma subunit